MTKQPGASFSDPEAFFGITASPTAAGANGKYECDPGSRGVSSRLRAVVVAHESLPAADRAGLRACPDRSQAEGSPGNATTWKGRKASKFSRKSSESAMNSVPNCRTPCRHRRPWKSWRTEHGNEREYASLRSCDRRAVADAASDSGSWIWPTRRRATGKNIWKASLPCWMRLPTRPTI